MQTRAMESLTGVDNTPQSLLMFGGDSVHALYDFLINYRLVSRIWHLFVYTLTRRIGIGSTYYINFHLTLFFNISNLAFALIPDPYTPR